MATKIPKLKFDGEKFKVQIKMMKFRIESLIKIHKGSSSSRRKEIANLLEDEGGEEQARMKCKHLIRDDYLEEAYQLLVMFSDEVLACTGLLVRCLGNGEAYCPPPIPPNTCSSAPNWLETENLSVPIASICWTAGRIDGVPELERIAALLRPLLKYCGCEKAEPDPRLVIRIGTRSTSVELVNLYLDAIAESFSISWRSDGREAVPKPKKKEVKQTVTEPTTEEPGKGKDSLPSFDELAARFDSLKRNS